LASCKKATKAGVHKNLKLILCVLNTVMFVLKIEIMELKSCTNFAEFYNKNSDYVIFYGVQDGRGLKHSWERLISKRIR
jgi:hypothetical protein